MKISKKDGTPRLEKGEVRIGNFFVRDEGDNEHIRVVDLNSCFTIRVWKRMPLGIWLDNMLKRGDSAHESIKAWVSVMWSVLSVAPDQEFVGNLLEVAKDALERHPDWYGVKSDATPEEDAEAVSDVEGIMEFESDVKEVMEKDNEREGE